MILRLFYFVLLLSCIASCHQNKDSQQQRLDGFSRKHEPVDANLDLRLGVRGDFSFKAYAEGMREAKHGLSARNSPLGFDKPWEVEGPFTRGGRVNVLAVDLQNPSTVYLGFSRGGLWRTIDNGSSWEAISDQLTFPSIGAIELDPSSNRIWIGTGDPNISGYFYVGDGVYYSDDNGVTWTNSGLGETGIINDIEIDPRDPNVMYAATMGQPYTSNNERGLYKSIDRGVTWTQILFDTTTAGISAVHLHPINPDILFATGWDRQRTLTSSSISGDHGILWRSDDAGQTWTNIQPLIGYELPEGRLAFTISTSDPNRLYLSTTDETNSFGGFYRSDDAGVSWIKTAQRGDEIITGLSERPLGGFGWFFGEIRVDPTDVDHVWMLGVRLWHSFDGGFTWEEDEQTADFSGIHADKHALEVGPGGEIWLGSDGGAYRRNLSSPNWVDIENIPTNMIYRVADSPFDTVAYACGMQDNGTSLGGELPAPDAWEDLFGGDGFQAVFNGFDTTSMLVETQNGRIWQLDLIDGFADDVSPFQSDERRSWDTPIATLYDSVNQFSYLLTGSNIAYEGEYDVPPFWETSGQLLTSDPDNQYFVITAVHIANDMTAYIGTSEGWIWKKELLSGDQWERLNTGFTERYITDITTNTENSNAVYLTMSEYRNGNTSPYILRSEDAGLTWNSLQGDLPQIAVNSILSIPESNDSVIVAATDAGVYASLDRGMTYMRLGTGMTNVPVFDLAYDPMSTRLIAGTFGRSLQTYKMSGLTQIDSSSSIPGTGFTQSEREFLAHPNPSAGNICLEATLLEVSRGSRLDLLNFNGQVMQTWEFASGQRKLKPCIDIGEDIINGPYFFRLQNRHDVQLVKIVLER